MNKFDILALGELNVDIILNRIGGMPEIGKEKFCQDMTVTLGSSTAIFAANAASLGAKVAFCGMVGNDAFGELVETSLRQKNVDTRWLIHTGDYATGATIVLNYDEDRANVTYQGAMDHMGLDNINKEIFSGVRHIHISSIFMQSALKCDLLQILRLASAAGVTTSLDTQWDPAETWDLDYKQILPLVTVFMPNENELRFLTHSATTQEAVEAIRPYINNAVIKQGSRGSLLLRKGHPDLQLLALLNTEVVDCIGAGDSFNAGFITCFTQGASLEMCQRYGNMTGAVSTTAAGGTGAFISRKAVETVGKQRFGWNE